MMFCSHRHFEIVHKYKTIELFAIESLITFEETVTTLARNQLDYMETGLKLVIKIVLC